MAAMLLTACGSTTSSSGESAEVIESNSVTTPIKTVTENCVQELNELKSTTQVNIDWSNAVMGDAEGQAPEDGADAEKKSQ